MKNYRENEIKWYIFAYLFLLIGLSNPFLLLESNIELLTKIEKLLSSTLLAGVICTLSFVFDCLYTSTLKETLLFLGFTHMPGKTILTRIKNGTLKDIRFRNEQAQECYNDVISRLPLNKKERRNFENEYWYNFIYRKHETDERIKQAHKDFLLCRDLYTTTITLFILTSAGMITNIIQFNFIPITYLITMLVLTNLSAHFKAHRFVNSVIAIDLSNKQS